MEYMLVEGIIDIKRKVVKILVLVDNFCGVTIYRDGRKTPTPLG